MKPLEEIIRASAERGDLNAFSIAFSDRGWEVAYRGVDDPDRRSVAHEDPVCAIYSALTGKAPPAPERKRRRRSSPKPAAPVAKPVSQFDDLLG